MNQIVEFVFIGILGVAISLGILFTMKFVDERSYKYVIYSSAGKYYCNQYEEMDRKLSLSDCSVPDLTIDNCSVEIKEQ